MEALSRQCERIINYIKSEGSITAAEAKDHLGIMNFSARLSELKEKGYVFEMTREKGKNRFDEKTCYGRYRLVQ